MVDDACLIVNLIETPDDYRFLTALGQIEAVSVFANGRVMVYLNAIVTRGGEDVICVEEPWRKCKSAEKYDVHIIKWIQYVTRGTRKDYYMASRKSRKNIKAQRKPE